MRQAVKASLYVVAQSAYGIVYTVKALHYGLLDSVEALTERLLNTCLTELDVIETVEDSGVVESCGEVCLRSDRRTIATAETATEAIAIVTPTEKKENDEPPQSVLTKHTVAIATAVSTIISIATYCVANSEIIRLFVHRKIILSKYKII